MDSSMFIGTWWALIPPLLAIILAFVTKEVYSSLFLGVAVGAMLYSGFHPWESFVNFFEIMKNSMNLNILIFDVLLGMIIVLMAKTGGSAAYGKWAGTKIKSKKSALLATTGLGILIFVDDYFNCLTVGSVMRPVTDRYKVSRAKLAYIIDSTAAPVCIIAPISSWAAAVNSYVPEDAGITGFQLFLRTIPYNLYAILTLFMVIFITVTAFDFGLMKKHEDNAAKGDLFTSGGEEFEQVSEVFETEPVHRQQNVFEFRLGAEGFGNRFVIADHIRFYRVADHAGVVRMNERVRHFLRALEVCRHFQFGFESGQSRRVLQGERKFVLARVHHLRVMQAETALIHQPALRVFHHRIVQVLFHQPRFAYVADAAERAFAARLEFLPDEHVPDVVIHVFPPCAVPAAGV